MNRSIPTLALAAAALLLPALAPAQVEEDSDGAGAFSSEDADVGIVTGEDRGDTSLVQPDEPAPAPAPAKEPAKAAQEAPAKEAALSKDKRGVAAAEKAAAEKAAAGPKPAPATPPEGLSLPGFDLTGTWEVRVEDDAGAFRPRVPGAKAVIEHKGDRLVGEELSGGAVIARFDGHASGETVRGNFFRSEGDQRRFVTLAYDAVSGEDGAEMLVTLRGAREGRDLRLKLVRLDRPAPEKGKKTASAKPAKKSEGKKSEGKKAKKN